MTRREEIPTPGPNRRPVLQQGDRDLAEAERRAVMRVAAGSPNATYDAVVREQAVLDLNRSIAAREQGLADLLQSSLDEAQRAIELERSCVPAGRFAACVHLLHRQGEHDRRQLVADTEQRRLDDIEAETDVRQMLLDARPEETAPAANMQPSDRAQRARMRDIAASIRADDRERRSGESADREHRRRARERQ